MRRKRLEPDKGEDLEEVKPRTPVRIKVKRLERGKEVWTPGKGEGQNRSTEGKRVRKKNSLSPSQRKIENYFLKLKGRPIGLSMRSQSPKETQGTTKSPLEGVLEVGACAETSRPGTSPLPVERGGGRKQQRKRP